MGLDCRAVFWSRGAHLKQRSWLFVYPTSFLHPTHGDHPVSSSRSAVFIDSKYTDFWENWSPCTLRWFFRHSSPLPPWYLQVITGHHFRLWSPPLSRGFNFNFFAFCFPHLDFKILSQFFTVSFWFFSSTSMNSGFLTLFSIFSKCPDKPTFLRRESVRSVG